MNTKKWSTWILIGGLGLLVLGFAGHAFPTRHAENPVRVYYDAAGGPVLFPHNHHCEDVGLDCTDCHHEVDGENQTQACRNCHTTGEGDGPTCDTCHPDEGFTSDMMDHDELREIEDHTCDGCHIPRRGSDAIHASCNSCHEDMEEGTFLTLTEENGKSSCDICHIKK